MLFKLKQQKRIDGQHMEPLMWKYYCDVPCPNRCNYCYVVDGIHLKILPQQMQAWSISINDDLASLENPPEVQLRSFQPVKSNQVNPFRNTQKNSCTNHSTQVPLTPEPHPFLSRWACALRSRKRPSTFSYRETTGSPPFA